MISLKENEATLKIIVPELQSLRHDTGAKPTVRTYSGAEEIKQIMNDMMETKHPVLAIFSWDDWMAFFGKSWMDDFIEARVRHHLPIQVLTPRTKTSIALRGRDVNELRATRFLPDSITINNSNLIYGNKVAIISVHTKRPVGILIEDEDIHHTMEVLFENLWLQSA